MRKINWGQLTSECKGLFDTTIAAFIDGLDSWLVKAIAGRNEVKMVIDELRAVQKSGSKMIDSAFAELKAMHAKMMGHELPRSTAAVGGTSVPRTTALTPTQAARVERKLAAKRSADARANRAAPNTTSNSTKKKAQQKKQKWRSGIPADRRNQVKHLPLIKLMAALPTDLQAQFAALPQTRRQVDSPTPSTARDAIRSQTDESPSGTATQTRFAHETQTTLTLPNNILME